MGFEDEETMSCWNNIDNDGDSYGWQHGGSIYGNDQAHSGSNYYASASANERRQLKEEILRSESQLVQLQSEMTALEKVLRNSENQ